VVRFRVWLTTFFALGALIAVFVSQAQQTDEGKPILKARAVNSESPTPTAKAKTSPHKKRKSPTPSPSAKSKKKKTASEESEASATPRETPEALTKPKAKKSPAKESSPKGKKKKKSTPGKGRSGLESASPKRKSSPKPSETPEAQATATPPRAIAVPSPNAPPSPSVARAKSALAAPVEEQPEQLTIEKYGYEKPKGFWARIFGGGGRSSSGAGYRYLTSSVRAQIDRAPVTRGRWQYIVVHNSGTRQGNAAAFDYYHRHFRRMQNGLAYHFVIGNGTSTGNGQIEVGDRWRRQINGGHVHSDYLNNIALGICLVGDFNRDQPTRAQLDCCEELIRYLRQRCGKFDNSHYPIVKPHRDINPPRWPTDCPGDVFPYSWFRRFQE
jgi:N-acetylmuramoyl-L-alanine amidase